MCGSNHLGGGGGDAHPPRQTPPVQTPPLHHTPHNRMTDVSENITFPVMKKKSVVPP